MEYYRKESGQLVIVCTNKACDERLIVPDMIETSLKEGQMFICHSCFTGQLITTDIQGYVRQTRCYQ